VVNLAIDIRRASEDKIEQFMRRKIVDESAQDVGREGRQYSAPRGRIHSNL